MNYRFLEHTADAGIEATGKTLEEAFAASATALAAWLCDISTVREMSERAFSAAAPDLESLLVDWLNNINFCFEVERFAFCRFEVAEVSTASLRATGYGEPMDPARHHPGEQVKSVTHHGVEVARTGLDPGAWKVRVFLDV